MPLALTVLSAIIFNIWVFHLCLSPSMFGPPILVTVLTAVLLYGYRASFAGIFSASAQPTI